MTNLIINIMSTLQVYISYTRVYKPLQAAKETTKFYLMIHHSLPSLTPSMHAYERILQLHIHINIYKKSTFIGSLSGTCLYSTIVFLSSPTKRKNQIKTFCQSDSAKYGNMEFKESEEEKKKRSGLQVTLKTFPIGKHQLSTT